MMKIIKITILNFYIYLSEYMKISENEKFGSW